MGDICIMAGQDPRRRIIRASKNADAALILTEKTAILAGNENSFVAVNKNGVSLKGNVSLVTDGTGIRRGGLFIQMPDMIRMLPSTLITPFPPQVPVPPFLGVRNLAIDVAFFSALLAVA